MEVIDHRSREYPDFICSDGDMTDTVKTVDENQDNMKKECTFYKIGKCKFGDKCFDIHEGDIVQVIDKRKTKLARLKPTEEKIKGKKPPLRTAGDVRKRIQWDPLLPEEHFTVGYVCRIEGLLEKPFSSFFWGHLADAEIDDLAIPQHRIQYFKYKNQVVWDKNLRLDHVFGSAGNSKTFSDILEEEQSEVEKYINVDTDDEDDDDLTVLVSSMPQTKTTSLLTTEAEMQYKQKMELRATHFLCVRVKNQIVADKVRKVQETVITADPILRSCAMPNEILHVTLAMIKCDTKTAIEEVSQLLREIKESIRELSSFDPNGNTIIARNLSTFGSRVLYSKLEVPPLFTEIRLILEGKLSKLEGVTITNNFNYVPHMTLLKVNRQVSKERHSKYLNSSLYDEHFYEEFGDISFDNIYFCVINDYRGVGGFYLTNSKIEF